MVDRLFFAPHFVQPRGALRVFLPVFLDMIDAESQDFKDDFDKMHTLMLNYAEFLRKSAKAYRDTQDAITADARKLTN